MDLIRKLLTYEPDKRISAEEALMHPWIKEKVVEKIDPNATKEAFRNLKAFRVKFISI
jgi:serine/threonine protein kinase